MCVCYESFPLLCKLGAQVCDFLFCPYCNRFCVFQGLYPTVIINSRSNYIMKIMLASGDTNFSRKILNCGKAMGHLPWAQTLGAHIWHSCEAEVGELCKELHKASVSEGSNLYGNDSSRSQAGRKLVLVGEAKRLVQGSGRILCGVGRDRSNVKLSILIGDDMLSDCDGVQGRTKRGSESHKKKENLEMHLLYGEEDHEIGVRGQYVIPNSALDTQVDDDTCVVCKKPVLGMENLHDLELDSSDYCEKTEGWEKVRWSSSGAERRKKGREGKEEPLKDKVNGKAAQEVMGEVWNIRKALGLSCELEE
ncbi:hypothetical protein VNO78_10365 [Psophocarpus tetragonolobus]|uniref:Uncharacterized protein n=1 Tax=Psophocarpus tetragonolobus TaxID=3891 RepID=A0AAN9XMW8_PSOTE